MQQDALVRTPLWSMMMKAFPSRNGLPNPKLAAGNALGQLAPFPQVSICLPPLLGHHLMETSLLDWSKVIIQLMKDGDEQNPADPRQQDTPIPHMPCKQTPWKPTPGSSGTQWLEDLFCIKQQAIPFLILTFDSSELTLCPFVKPSQHNEPPIPGPSQCSQPQVPSHEDSLTREPEPEETPMQSTEEPFARPATPPSIIIINNIPIGSPPSLEIPPIAAKKPTASSPPAPSYPQSHDEAQQEFTNLRPTLMIPQAIFHESINRILLSQPQRMTLLRWCCGNYSLGPSWGQLATPYLYGKFGPFWCSMAFLAISLFHGLRPYPAIIGLSGQFPYPQPPGLYLCFWAWGVSLSPRGFWVP
ncbi:hypothetical protein O181_088329 [Austropuccinia psidii MF-1]|uniref:Uncharacterized protein n=1 Tax=Austropuccinia psidii MF-1 TaxID=1389203 RepID=A0A9Q3P3G2_9BASI|nr:hypothetical protein [Austropuccinia psidii MF-1]